MGTWQLHAQRPAPALGSELPGVLAEVGGVLYYLHEAAKTPATTAEKYPFYKLVAGAWSALTGPAHLESELFAPTDAGQTFSGSWWRRAQAYDLGDGRIAFAGWAFYLSATYSWYQPDPYGTRYLIPGAIYHATRLVRVYDVAGDSWTDYLDTVEAGCGDPVQLVQYENAPNLNTYLPEDPKFSWYAVACRAPDGKLLMINDGQYAPLQARVWDPATGLFADASGSPELPTYVCRSFAATWDSYGGTYYDCLGWCGYRAGSLEAARYVTGNPGSVARWGGSSWASVAVVPEMVAPIYSDAVQAIYTALDEETAWTGQHQGDAAAARPYGVRYHGGSPSGLRAYRYDADEPTYLGDLLGETFRGANIYSGAGGIYLVAKSGVYELDSASGDVTAPTVEFASPSAGATLSGAATIGAHAEDDVALARVKLYLTPSGGSAALVGTAEVSEEGVLELDASIVCNTTLFADGAATLTLYAHDRAGNVSDPATLAVTIDNSATVDNTPPTVTIQRPAAAAHATGPTTIVAHLEDDVQLAGCRLFVRGSQVGADVALSGVLAEQEWTVDLSDWANGAAVVQVFGWDAAGNEASDAVTIVVDNLLADADRVLYSVELPVDDPVWRLSAGARLASLKVDVVTGEVPADARQVYCVYPYWKAGAAGIAEVDGAPDWSLMDPFSTREVLDVAPSAAALRIALVARAAQRESRWTIDDADEFFRLVRHGSRTLALTRGPVRVYELIGADLPLLVDLASTPFAGAVLSEAASCGDKLLLGTDVGLIAVDLDAGDAPALVRLDGASYATTALAARGDVALLRQAGALWSFTWPSSRSLSATMPGGLLWANDALAIAASTGTEQKLYAYVPEPGAGDSYGGRWLLSYDVGEEVARIFRDPDAPSSELALWVGTSAGIHRSTPTWTLDAAAAHQVRAFAKWRGSLWSAGAAAGLWRRGPAGWVEQLQLADVAAVNDLLVLDDRLYCAVSKDLGGGSYEAQIVRLQVDLAGDFRCGPNPPDVLPRAVDYYSAEVQ